MDDGRITDKHPYGMHIALTCKNHPDLKWSTKNIGALFEGRIYFARTLFYVTYETPECSCSQKLLVVVD